MHPADVCAFWDCLVWCCRKDVLALASVQLYTKKICNQFLQCILRPSRGGRAKKDEIVPLEKKVMAKDAVHKWVDEFNIERWKYERKSFPRYPVAGKGKVRKVESLQREN